MISVTVTVVCDRCHKSVSRETAVIWRVSTLIGETTDHLVAEGWRISRDKFNALQLTLCPWRVAREQTNAYRNQED